MFDELRELIETSGTEAGLERLIAQYKEEKNYPGVFEARLMAARLSLGLPAILNGAPDGADESLRKSYEEAQVAAARETGALFLADGDIYRAWPYYRALGDKQPIIDALREASPDAETVDGLVEIAFHEGVDPKRGFELILEHYGICRAITNFGHYPSDEGRAECAAILVDQLTSELSENIQRAVESVEGRPAQASNLGELVQGRDWLFEGNNYYADTSHVSSIVQMSPQWDDPATLRKVIDLTEYGRRLGEMYQFAGDPPFEDTYTDHAVYLRALLGENVDEAVEHFRAKISDQPDPFGNVPAQVLVRLLLEVDRVAEAAETATRYLADADPRTLACPSPPELLAAAGDAEGLEAYARAKGDMLAYAAAVDLVQSVTGPSKRTVA